MTAGGTRSVLDLRTHTATEDAIRDAVEQLVVAIREAVRAEAAPAGPERLLSVDQAAAALGIGRSRLYGEITSGRVRSLTVGRRRLVPSSAIAELIDAGH